MPCAKWYMLCRFYAMLCSLYEDISCHFSTYYVTSSTYYATIHTCHAPPRSFGPPSLLVARHKAVHRSREASPKEAQRRKMHAHLTYDRALRATPTCPVKAREMQDKGGED